MPRSMACHRAIFGGLFCQSVTLIIIKNVIYDIVLVSSVIKVVIVADVDEERRQALVVSFVVVICHIKSLLLM